MDTLRIDEFTEFFREVHGSDKTPFRWQTDLLQDVWSKHRWPGVIDLPTGAGKTACIDIAVFALALAAKDEQAWCSRRIAMVVDRRVVVDQAARRGYKIAKALSPAPPDSVCARVAARLAALSSEGVPLRVAVLRGGIPRDVGWARTPDQPLVIASTVDQLGSRLLFRGYGVSWSMRPVHAGLLGNDILILLDEVHLSRPIEQTLRAIKAIHSHGRGGPQFHVAALSATPGPSKEKPFTLPAADRQNVVMKRRLEALKPAALVECHGREALVRLAAENAATLVKRPAEGIGPCTDPAGRPTQAIAVVVNRVDTALEIARELRRDPAVTSMADVVLLTGRMRPLDRDDRVSAIEPRVAAVERRRENEQRPIIVVATQCIEAGADFDFDALVTEHASLDALRQRFGRLDRLGEYQAARACIIAVKERNKKGEFELPKDDPIYGESLSECWEQLMTWWRSELRPKARRGRKLGPAPEYPIVDFGIAAMERRVHGQDVSSLLAPKTRAASMFPAYLGIWAQTSPPPFAEPYLPLFLHGPQSGPAEVQIVWRRDLDDEGIWNSGDEGEGAIARVAALPPTSLEAVSVPFRIARNWLANRKSAVPLVDIEKGAARADDRDEPESQADSFVRAVVWRGNRTKRKGGPVREKHRAWSEDDERSDESFVLTKLARLRPGDTVVVPCSQGGLRDGSFDPNASEVREPVDDLAERATISARRRAVLRLYEPVLTPLGLTLTQDGPHAQDDAADWVHTLADALADARRIEVDDTLVLLRSRKRVQVSATVLSAGELEEEEVTQEETSPFTGRPVRLSAHTRHVVRWVRAFTKRLCLPYDIKATLAFAAWLHDLGKADPRFQQLLRDGSEIALLKDMRKCPKDWLLAKSGISGCELSRTRLAARRSGYPDGTRHEVLSLAMIEKNASVREKAQRRRVIDLDLLFHLVASHHGWCRPFAPAVFEPDGNLTVERIYGGMKLVASVRHGLERLDSPLADRFASLGRRYGWLQLAWLEAILRLADHRASEEEQD